MIVEIVQISTLLEKQKRFILCLCYYSMFLFLILFVLFINSFIRVANIQKFSDIDTLIG